MIIREALRSGRPRLCLSPMGKIFFDVLIVKSFLTPRKYLRQDVTQVCTLNIGNKGGNMAATRGQNYDSKFVSLYVCSLYF